MIDIVIAIVIGWFVALVSSFVIWGIIELFKGVDRLVEGIYYRLINFSNKKNA